MSLQDRLRDFNFRDLDLRERINENQNLIAVVCFVVIAVAVGYIVMNSSGRRVASYSSEAYYYDTVTGKIFTDNAELFAPITSPDGNPAVLVHLFTCTGDCNEDDWFVGYYEKFTDEAKARLEQLKAEGNEEELYDPALYDTAVLYSIDGKEWFGADDAGTQDLVTSNVRCEDPEVRPKYCRVK